jgi:hypothetical protein
VFRNFRVREFSLFVIAATTTRTTEPSAWHAMIWTPRHAGKHKDHKPAQAPHAPQRLPQRLPQARHQAPS